MERCVIYFGRILMVCPQMSLIAEITGWGVSPRGAGFLFGGDVVKSFVHTNGLDFIARAHQLILEGYKQMFDSTIVTVWSAPNYCYRCGNVASILQLDDALNQKYKTFDSPPQAYVSACDFASNRQCTWLACQTSSPRLLFVKALAASLPRGGIGAVYRLRLSVPIIENRIAPCICCVSTAFVSILRYGWSALTTLLLH